MPLSLLQQIKMIETMRDDGVNKAIISIEKLQENLRVELENLRHHGLREEIAIELSNIINGNDIKYKLATVKLNMKEEANFLTEEANKLKQIFCIWFNKYGSDFGGRGR